VNWQHFMRFLASIGGRWDLAILVNLTEGSSRPTELLDAINEQACDEAPAHLEGHARPASPPGRRGIRDPP
jgi:hypothetical protein